MSAMRASLLLPVACGLLVAAPPSVWQWLVLDREAVLAGEAWRAWTGHLLHFTWAHAVADGVALAISSWIVEHRMGSRATWWLLLGGAPLIGLGLFVAVPDLGLYAGASGIATLMAVVAGGLLWRAEPRLRVLLVSLVFAALIKLALDAGGDASWSSTLPDGVRVVWQAHTLGALLGALFLVGARERLPGRAGWRGARPQ